jgi:RNA polymerase sigma-70 factor (ECF subfamily)
MPEVERAEAEERALIARARDGDAVAFEALVAPYDRLLLGVAIDLLGDPEDARDAYQEGLLAVFRALPGFRGDSRFSTWMYRVALNQALRLRGRRERAPSTRAAPLEVLDETRAAAAVAGGPDPEQRALRRELGAQIEAAMAELSAREHLAFVLCHLHGEPLKQAAEMMECTLGTVKSYLFRARAKLRASLTTYLER